jgi:hypothetical protein
MFHITFTYSARKAHRFRHYHLPGAHLRPDRRGRDQPVHRGARAGTPTPAPTETPRPPRLPKPVYARLCRKREVTLPPSHLPRREKAHSLSITRKRKRVWTVTADDQSIVVEARRFGHGVGMSQYAPTSGKPVWHGLFEIRRFTSRRGTDALPGCRRRLPSVSSAYPRRRPAALPHAAPHC